MTRSDLRWPPMPLVRKAMMGKDDKGRFLISSLGVFRVFSGVLFSSLDKQN